MSSNIVDPSSVQKQFTILNKECDNLRQTITATHKAHLQEGQLLQTLHQTRTFIIDQIRIAHATLGAKNKRKQLLKDEIQRLHNLSTKDRTNILDISERLDQLEEEERKRKRKFIDQMNLMNDEHNQSLRACTDHDILKYITTDSIRKLLDNSVKEEVEKEEEHHRQNYEAHAMHTKKIKISRKSSNENYSWHQLSIGIKDSVQLLNEATTKIMFEVNTQKRLQKLVKQIRLEMMKDDPSINNTDEPFGPTKLDELEKLWDGSLNNTDNDYNTSNKSVSHHINSSSQA